MANSVRPRGFIPVGKVQRLNAYVAGATVYPGDAVVMSSSGTVAPTTAGATILGVAFSYGVSTDTVMVCDDPEQRYLVQASSSEITAQTSVGNNADIVATAGNATYKASRQALDSSTAATGSAQLTILGVETRPNNALGTYVDLIVRINEHQTAKDAFAGV